MFINERPITAEVKGTAKPAKPFAEETDPYVYVVTLSTTFTLATLCLWSTPGNSLESALTKNASVNLLECAHTKSLDLKLLRMNTYKKCGVSPLLAFERLRPRGREAKKRGRKGGKGVEEVKTAGSFQQEMLRSAA